MKNRIKYLTGYYFFWVLLFIIEKPIFLLFHWENSKNFSFSEWMQVITHGFVMDLSAAGYLSIFTCVIILISSFFNRTKWAEKIIFYYTAVILFFVLLIYVGDLFLYSYWGFRLDITPLFYLESPKNAAASASWAVYLAAFALFVFSYAIAFFLFRKLHRSLCPLGERSFWSVLPSSLLIGVLFILIRGGVGVSTMNAGRVYFSKSVFLDHAAINPFWNFLNSCFKDNSFDKQYRYLDAERASVLFHEMIADPAEQDSTEQVLRNNRPNIIFIVLEGIGSNVIETLGGEKGVAPNLSRLADEGILFRHFYASSFRTDRGLVAILSGYPGQPNTSLMKYPSKTQHVPKIPLTLKENGYDIAFYYGGDENFTNLRSYLINSGFEKIISEKDFPKEDLSAKWGAYDHILLNRVSEDLKNQTAEPFLKLILTLSSHEPFDVPMKKLQQPYLNAVAYTDSCIGAFISEYKKSRWWNNSLIIILPDHAFRYPNTMSNSEENRFKIPMIWLGGAIKQPMKVDKIASQIDIARTLFTQLNMNASEYIFSQNVFGKNYKEYAFYTFSNGFGLMTPHGKAIFDCDAGIPLKEDDPKITEMGKAFLQSLYDDLEKR